MSNRAYLIDIVNNIKVLNYRKSQTDSSQKHEYKV